MSGSIESKGCCASGEAARNFPGTPNPAALVTHQIVAYVVQYGKSIQLFDQKETAGSQVKTVKFLLRNVPWGNIWMSP